MLQIGNKVIDYSENESIIKGIGTLKDMLTCLRNQVGDEEDDSEIDLIKDILGVDDLSNIENDTYYLVHFTKICDDPDADLTNEYSIYPVEYNFSCYWGVNLY